MSLGTFRGALLVTVSLLKQLTVYYSEWVGPRGLYEPFCFFVPQGISMSFHGLLVTRVCKPKPFSSLAEKPLNRPEPRVPSYQQHAYFYAAQLPNNFIARLGHP
jgi:hypothetical protein